MNARQLIEHLKLEPLPVEGGYFRQTYCAAETLAQSALPSRYRTDKPFGTAIYYLLTSEPDSFSALHRLPTDEIYHFYLGDPVELLLLYPNGSSQRVLLGPDLLGGQQVQFVAPRDAWQGSRLRAGGAWALLGTTMAPGFTPEDFVAGDREELMRRYPEQAELIHALTRTP
ncbi:MAG: cupin domain-containing protein [Candidatus Acidiferrales bacterium]